MIPSVVKCVIDGWAIDVRSVFEAGAALRFCPLASRRSLPADFLIKSIWESVRHHLGIGEGQAR